MLSRLRYGWSIALAAACQPHPPADPFPGPVKAAEFGIFYGGQVQERDVIPLELDRAKQSQGIRIDFDAPLTVPARVTWELDIPGTTRGVRDLAGRRGKGRLVKLDEALVPVGRGRFEHEIVFRPDDPVGMWNLRVRVDGRVVIDRPFEVRPPDE